MRARWPCALGLSFLLGGPTGAIVLQPEQVATVVVYYGAPEKLPDQTVNASCVSPSHAAWFRNSAFSCVVGGSRLDPCFETPAGALKWCVDDPRRPDAGVLVKMAGLMVVDYLAPGASRPSHRAWFFELTDGSTCRPLSAPGRVVEGESELYVCKYAAGGEADAVLGDLDSSHPVWTVHKVLINKKTEPQTIKSLVVASVRTVWQ